MAVIFLNYKEEQIPVSVGYYALKRFKLETGRSFVDIDDDDLEDLGILFWHSLEAGYKHENRENPHSRENLDLIFDEVMIDFNSRLGDFFLPSPTTQAEPLPPAGKGKRGKN